MWVKGKPFRLMSVTRHTSIVQDAVLVPVESRLQLTNESTCQSRAKGAPACATDTGPITAIKVSAILVAVAGCIEGAWSSNMRLASSNDDLGRTVLRVGRKVSKLAVCGSRFPSERVSNSNLQVKMEA